MFIYQLTIRPASTDTTPVGINRQFIDNDAPGYRMTAYGQVAYDQPLSLADIEQYSLLPLSEIDALNGRHFVVRGLGDDPVVVIKVDNVRDITQVAYFKDAEGYFNDMSVISYVDFMHLIDKGDFIEVSCIDASPYPRVVPPKTIESIS